LAFAKDEINKPLPGAGTLTRLEHRSPVIAFWEVDTISVGDELRFSVTKDFYHITDKETISGVPPETAVTVLQQIKAERQGKSITQKKFITASENHPITVEAVVTLCV